MGRSKDGKGGQALLLMVLLAVLGGAGTWNYRRNVEAENQLPRPYRSYSDADLEKLLGAYQLEVDKLDKRYARSSSRKVSVRDHGLIGDQIQEFERVQRASRSKRNAGYELSEMEATLQTLHDEQAKRAGERDQWQLLLRRVFTYRP